MLEGLHPVFLTLLICPLFLYLRRTTASVKAGLLTLGSLYFLHLPARFIPCSDISQGLSPITAAGPLPIFTGFPIKPNGTLPNCISDKKRFVNRKNYRLLPALSRKL